MVSYRITKYNPTKRNKKGYFLDASEWISISDIGRSNFPNFNFEEYEKVENTYVESIRLILTELKIDTVRIDALENSQGFEGFKKFVEKGYLKNLKVDYQKDIAPLKDGFEIKFENIDKIIRLILREAIWMKLINDKIEILFGYDYYMYAKCSELETNIIQAIQNMGLFIESNNQKNWI